LHNEKEETTKLKSKVIELEGKIDAGLAAPRPRGDDSEDNEPPFTMANINVYIRRQNNMLLGRVEDESVYQAMLPEPIPPMSKLKKSEIRNYNLKVECT
jgi:hypothetical protein